ncbi:MAG: hypothetical protein ACM3MI_12245 [Clostridiales bacterium]
MGIQTTRKCFECKGMIVLEDDKFIYDKNYFHYECYVKSLMNKKRKPLEESEARTKADELIEESKRNASDIIAKNHLFKWLMRHYNLVVLPNYIYTKLDAIFDGTYKGLTQSISAEDFLDMIERKWNDLCGLYDYNISIGKKMDDVGRLNYDIAVILAKSTSYYKWKRQQEINKKENEELIASLNTKMNSNNKNKIAVIEKSDSNDLSSYLEEI